MSPVADGFGLITRTSIQLVQIDIVSKWQTDAGNVDERRVGRHDAVFSTSKQRLPESEFKGIL